MKGINNMVLSEKYEALVNQFTELETNHKNVTSTIETLTTDKTNLQSKIDELTKVNAEMEGKLVAFNENPNLVSELTDKVAGLETEKTDLTAKVGNLESEVSDLKVKVEDFNKNVETKAGQKAVEIIAGNRVSQIPLTASTDNTIKLGGVSISTI